MLAMANAGKRMGKGTNGSQFFITVGATTWLQGKHTIFGEVADGPSREVVDKIAAVPTGASDKPGRGRCHRVGRRQRLTDPVASEPETGPRAGPGTDQEGTAHE